MRAGNISQWFVLFLAAVLFTGVGPQRLHAKDLGSNKTLRAGAYAIDITPEQFPVLVNGGMYSRTADKVVDRLHARCLVLDNGANKIAIIVVDSCMLSRALLDQAKQLAAKATGISTKRMLISATHTHSAPAAKGCLGTDVDEKYARFLPARIARGIQLAANNLEPARIGWAKSRDPDNVYNRRWLMKEGTARTNPFSGKTNDRVQMNPGFNNPNKIRQTGAVDDDVWVLSVQAKNGRPIALLANYSTHYAGSPALSSDYFGAFADKIAKLIDADAQQGKPAFVGIMSNGTSGDTNCIDFSRTDPRKFDYHSVGDDTARAAFEAYGKINYQDWAPIVMEEDLLKVNVRMPSEDEVARAKAFLATEEGKKLRSIPAVYARETVLLSQLPPTRELKLQAIRIGDLGIAAIPNEVFTVTGLTIKKESPLPATFTIELANGAEGYLPPPDQHKLGGYTTWRARTSCLEEEAEPKIRAKVMELLGKVAANPASGERKLPTAASGERKLPESNSNQENELERHVKHAQGADAPRSPKDAPRSPSLPEPKSPLSPEDSLKYLHVRPGMKVELVAAEPLVRDPVAFDWGPDGKLWVVEYLDYPTGIDGKGTGGGRVVFLEDKDGDGRYDKSTVFIDKLNFPTGVMAWRNGILITAAPDILYAEDTDHDGKADVRKALYTGFFEANQQLRVNGLRWGLDGWVYCASGSHHGGYGKETRIKSAKTGELAAIGAHDFRIKPDEGLIEPVSGPSQFGRNRNAWGNWFGCQNAKPMWHYVLDDRYLRRNPHVAYPDSKVLISDVPGQRPVFPRSRPGKFYHASQAGRFTSANSAMIYCDELLGEQFNGNSFVSEPVHNLVHREIVERDGATFKSHKPKDEETTEFLASRDTWFRPTTIRTGPDGALWIADMYREIIEHPQWVSDELKPIVDVRIGTDRGRIYRIYPEGKQPRKIPRLDKLDTTELIALLESPNMTLRDMAQMRIVSEQVEGADDRLRKLALEGDRPETRLQALCTLNGLGAADAKFLRQPLKDEHFAVRLQAIRLLEPFIPHVCTDGAPLLAMEKDADPAVRLQLACTAGEWIYRGSGGLLMHLAQNEPDNEFLVAAMFSSLDENNIESAVRNLLIAPNRPSPPENVLRGVLATAIGVNARKTVALAADRISKRDAADSLAAWQLNALVVLHDELGRQQRFIDAAIEGDDKQRIIAQVDRAFDVARRIVSDKDSAIELRASAVRLLGRQSRLANADYDLIGKQLAPQNPGRLQLAAVDALARTGQRQAPELLLRGWKSHGPSLRSEILDALLSRGAWTEALLASIDRGEVAAADIDAARRERLLKSGSATIRAKAAKLFAGGTNPDRAKVIAQYRPVLETISSAGDVQRGKAVFKLRCSACHKLDDVGNEVGPNLQGLTDKSPGNLLESILDPNRAVEPKFVNYTAVTEQGRIYNGILADESGGSLTLLDAEGKKHVLLRRDLEELAASGKSLMPEGLEKDISSDQMRDLLMYLRQALDFHAE